MVEVARPVVRFLVDAGLTFDGQSGKLRCVECGREWHVTEGLPACPVCVARAEGGTHDEVPA